MFNPPFYWCFTLCLFGISGKNLNRMFYAIKILPVLAEETPWKENRSGRGDEDGQE
jgi:hypothetical protein